MVIILIVLQYLESNVKGVYAGGDVAFAPVLGTQANIGHWQLAQYHGHLAALNIVGKKTEVKTVPFFWTMLFGKGVRYAGNPYCILWIHLLQLSFINMKIVLYLKTLFSFSLQIH